MSYFYSSHLNVNPPELLKIRSKAWIYWKDTKGKYLGCNDLMAESLNLNTSNDIIGMDDHDLNIAKEEASFYQDCDRAVMDSGLTMQFNDSATIADKTIRFCVIKMPMIANSKNLIGIIGISHYLQEAVSQAGILTNRQREILFNVVKGRKNKEIATLLNLSSRTVEHYVEALKNKLRCPTRAELILKAVEMKLF